MALARHPERRMPLRGQHEAAQPLADQPPFDQPRFHVLRDAPAEGLRNLQQGSGLICG